MKLLRQQNRTFALTLVELLVVIAVLALMGLLILPTIRPARATHCRISCVNNLKQVGLSFRLFADDNNDKYPMQLSATNGGAIESVNAGIAFPTFQVMSNELSTPKIVVCPEDSQRASATNFTTDFNNSRLSYFVGIDANQTNANMLLSGDRNLTLNGVATSRRFVTLTKSSVVGWTVKPYHNGGNVALADGSVQQVTASGFQKLIANTGVATNRLVLP